MSFSAERSDGQKYNSIIILYNIFMAGMLYIIHTILTSYIYTIYTAPTPLGILMASHVYTFMSATNTNRPPYPSISRNFRRPNHRFSHLSCAIIRTNCSLLLVTFFIARLTKKKKKTFSCRMNANEFLVCMCVPAMYYMNAT